MTVAGAIVACWDTLGAAGAGEAAPIAPEQPANVNASISNERRNIFRTPFILAP